ncbi:MAG: hypothetical protein H6925_04665 [Holosporaceae bacterium]|nr:MAG: hypothetical protein H6925_04665 [Holosporaceae bacterium]
MTQLKTEARAKGDTILKKSFPKEHDYLVNDLAPFCQEMSDAIIDHAYGKIWARDELSKRMRSLVTVVSLAAVGAMTMYCASTLRQHLATVVHWKNCANLFTHALVCGLSESCGGLDSVGAKW